MADMTRVRELDAWRRALAREVKSLMLQGIRARRHSTPAERVRMQSLRNESDRITREIQALFDAHR